MDRWLVRSPNAKAVFGIACLAVDTGDCLGAAQQITEKDLGPNTTKVASAMTTAHLDATWTSAEPMP